MKRDIGASGIEDAVAEAFYQQEYSANPLNRNIIIHWLTGADSNKTMTRFWSQFLNFGRAEENKITVKSVDDLGIWGCFAWSFLLDF